MQRRLLMRTPIGTLNSVTDQSINKHVTPWLTDRQRGNELQWRERCNSRRTWNNEINFRREQTQTIHNHRAGKMLCFIWRVSLMFTLINYIVVWRHNGHTSLYVTDVRHNGYFTLMCDVTVAIWRTSVTYAIEPCNWSVEQNKTMTSRFDYFPIGLFVLLPARTWCRLSLFVLWYYTHTVVLKLIHEVGLSVRLLLRPIHTISKRQTAWHPDVTLVSTSRGSVRFIGYIDTAYSVKTIQSTFFFILFHL